MKKLLIILLIIVLGGTLVLFWPKKAVETPLRASESVSETVTPSMDCSVTDDAVLSSINKVRSENGVGQVSYNKLLDVMADYRANEQNGSMDNHVGFKPYLDSHFFGDYFYVNNEIQSRHEFCTNSDYRVRAFVNSQPHWKVLNESKWDSVGVGFVNNELVIEFGDLR